MKIDVTDVARNELKKLIEEKKTEQSLRIYIASYGWGGPTFGMSLDEAKDGDEIIKDNDFEFVLEEDLTSNYGKFTVDYSDNWLRRGFNVIPDRVGAGC